MGLRIFKTASSDKGINAVISFEQLKASLPIDKDINRPKPLSVVLEDIHKVLLENGIPFEQGPVYVERASAYNQARGKNNLELSFDQKRPDSFREWQFNNIYTQIVITDALNEFEGAVAIAYSPFGMQLAFGLTYEGRSHFAQFGEDDHIISTIACGDIKVMAYFVMMHKVKQWFPLDNSNILAQMVKTRSLMNKPITYAFVLQFVEQFYNHSLKYNDCLEDNTLIDFDEFEKFAGRLRTLSKEHFSNKENITAWDLFAQGSTILHPETDFNLRVLIPISFIWGGYVFSRLT